MVTVKMLRENRVKLLLMTGVMFGSVIIMALLCGYSEYSDSIKGYGYSAMEELNNETAIGMFILFLFGTIAGSMVFDNLSSKTNRLSVLMLPATTFEKYIVRLILFLPVFVILFIGAFYLGDFLRFLMMKWLLAGDPEANPMLYSLSVLTGDDEKDFQVLKLYCSVMIVCWSAFTLGSTLWERQAYLKTAFALGLLWAIYTVIGVTVSEWATPEPIVSGGYIITKAVLGNSVSIMNCVLSLAVVIALVNYTLSYFRMRESEIINRW